MGEEFIVFLPIDMAQADIIGMPAGVFEEAVRRLGRPLPDEIERRRDNLEKMRLTAETFAANAGQARNGALEEAAKVADAVSTTDWKGGDEWAAGFVDGKNAAAAAIRALKEKE
jgi:hypothetical protein